MCCEKKDGDKTEKKPEDSQSFAMQDGYQAAGRNQ